MEQYNIPQLVKALQAPASTFAGTPSTVVAGALAGLARFSTILANNKDQLHTIVAEGDQIATVLNPAQRRPGQPGRPGRPGPAGAGAAPDRDQGNCWTAPPPWVPRSTRGWGPTNASLNALLTNLQNVSAPSPATAGRSGRGLPLLAAFSRYAANITGSGPFADASVPTLLIPDNLISQCCKPGAFPSPNPLVGCRP